MNKLYKNIFVASLSVMLFSCEGFVTEVEEIDPTSPVDAAAEQILPSAQVNYFSTMQGEMARTAGMWSGYFTGSDRQYISLYNYQTTAGDYDSPWGNVYSGVLQQLRIIQGKAESANNLTTLGITQVMEGHIMSTAAAVWGDIPYREACNATEFPNPAYDPQTQVMRDLIVVLDDAIENLESGTGTRAGDIIGTSTGQWVRAANSVKAKIHLYLGEYAEALASAQLGIVTNADNLVSTHGTSNGLNRNIFYDFMVRQRLGYMTSDDAFLPKLMDASVAGNRNNAKTNEATRMAYYFTGSNPAYTPRTSAGGIFATNASYILVSADETNLIIAECQARLNGVSAGVTALNNYRAELGARFGAANYLPFADADFDNGGIENPDNISSANALLREIAQEKYVALYGQIEVFTEVRRTGNLLGVPVNAGSQLPARFLYSQNEVNANPNTPKPIPTLFTATSLF